MSAKKEIPEKPVKIRHPKVMDVAKPGVLPPLSGSARPVIVTNRTVMRDPMMAPPEVSDISTTDTSGSSPDNGLPTKITIAPLEPAAPGYAANSAEKQPAEPRAVQSTAPDHQKDALVPENAADSQPEANLPDTATSTPNDEPDEVSMTGNADLRSDSDHTVLQSVQSKDADKAESEPLAETETAKSNPRAAKLSTSLYADKSDDSVQIDGVDELDGAAEADTAKLDALAAEAAEYEKLIEDKTYFLELNATQKRRNIQIYILGVIVIIILALAWLDIALDAGFVHIPGVQPLTHIFEQ